MGGKAAEAALAVRPNPRPDGRRQSNLFPALPRTVLKRGERIKDYILAGDCMQVVPSQRLSARHSGRRRWISTGRCAD
jgi:anthranilate/para-aminobenzoate synthase component I